MPGIMGLVKMYINQHPELMNNPQAKEYLDIILKNDSKRGEEIANNICQTYNVSKEEGINKAMSYFKSLFNNR